MRRWKRRGAMAKGRRYHALALGRQPIVISARMARSFDMAGVNLRRWNSGRAPLIVEHRMFDLDAIVGRIAAGSAQVTERGLECDVELLPDGDLPAGLLARLDFGLTSISVGLHVVRMERIEEDDLGMMYLAREWEPEELSLVPVGADRNARLEGVS